MRKVNRASLLYCGNHFQAENGAFERASGTLKTTSKSRKTKHGQQHKEEQEVYSLIVRKDGDLEEEIGLSPVSLLSILKACAQNKDVYKGCEMHCDIARKGMLEDNVFLGSALVNMYAKCGALSKAQDVFDQLQVKNAILWNALISGYAQQGLDEAALSCFEQMQCEGLCPDAVTFTCVLKASGSIKALDKGQEVHDHVVSFGLLDHDMFVGSALVDMYAKCGSLDEAQESFDKLPVQNLVCWNALIAGYAQRGYGGKALECHKHMQRKGLHANASTYVSLLKSCGTIKKLNTGQDLHGDIVRDGLLQNEKVGTAVIDMYVKCGMLKKAKEVFNDLLVRNEVVWNAIIGGCVQEEDGEEAFKFFTQMLCEGVCPDAITYTCICKGSCSAGAVDKGIEIHARIVGDGLLEKETVVGTPLVDMYAKFGLMEQAQVAFDRLGERNVVSWTALIGGYAQLGQCKEALDCYVQMQRAGLFPNAVTFACILKACGSVGASVEGREIHAQIVKCGLLAESILGTPLSDMHGKCGMLGKALEVFEELPSQDIVSWNGLIAWYTQLEDGEKALECIKDLKCMGLSPNAATLCRILKACSSLGVANRLRRIVAQILKEGMLRTEDAVAANALLKSLVNCGLLAKAHEVFDELPNQDVVTWNTLLSGYLQHGHDQKAFQCIEQMKGERASQDAVTFCSILKACGRIEAGHKWGETHAQLLQEATLLEKDVVVGTALVDMYCKCGMLTEAQKVFDEFPVRDPVLWNVLITGYTQRAQCDEALDCFESMQAGGFPPNSVTFSSVLKICGSLGAILLGQQMHERILRVGLQQGETIIGNALVDMYANCGMVAEAQSTFDRLSVRNLVSWNSLISGYAQLGKDENAFSFFDKMMAEGQKPDIITFIYLLNSCNHSGLLDEGQTILETMSSIYGMNPSVEHLNCMVDCLGRAGRLDKMVVVLNEMPFSANLLMWHTVLGACQIHGNVELRKWAFENAVWLDKNDGGAFVCRHNIFSAVAGSEQDVSIMKPVRRSIALSLGWLPAFANKYEQNGHWQGE